MDLPIGRAFTCFVCPFWVSFTNLWQSVGHAKRHFHSKRNLSEMQSTQSDALRSKRLALPAAAAAAATVAAALLAYVVVVVFFSFPLSFCFSALNVVCVGNFCCCLRSMELSVDYADGL